MKRNLSPYKGGRRSGSSPECRGRRNRNGSKFIIVFITIDSPANAQKLADKLLSARKAACVNIIPKVSSQYWWQGKIEKADELMLVVKTRAALLDELITLVKQNHPYTVRIVRPARYRRQFGLSRLARQRNGIVALPIHCGRNTILLALKGRGLR